MSIPVSFQEFVEDVTNHPLLPEFASELRELNQLLKTATGNQQKVQSTTVLLQNIQDSLDQLSADS